MVREDIENALREALEALGAGDSAFSLEYPPAETNADYATNAALSAAKALGKKPREVAEALRASLQESALAAVARIDIAPPGFINFTLSQDFFNNTISQIAPTGKAWGGNTSNVRKRIMVEYTQPNPFKEFHIGHLMSNALGESVARLLEATGAMVIRANYQGDVGPHVAKALFALLREGVEKPTIAEIGKAYVEGDRAYESDEHARGDIDILNKAIYEHSDPKVETLYEYGRALSLKHFEEIYQLLGTKFDEYFFESETGPRGIAIVRAHKEFFEESDGAMVFRGEAMGLHTRVFITRMGTPTYEAKELGLAELKRERVKFDHSITITANEQSDYFKVVFAALFSIHPAWRGVFEHLPHGMMQLASGKMSSRKGNVITGEALIKEMILAAKDKMTGREPLEKERVAEEIAVAAIKYSVLKQSSGKNIIFDEEKSLSLEGDSGPYLQYAHTRCVSILKKAKEKGVLPAPKASFGEELEEAAAEVQRLLPRFPEIVARAAEEYEPHYLVHYLAELSGAFNSWYGQVRVLDGGSREASRLVLVDAVRQTLCNGLFFLGCAAPEEM
ncbi:MAG: arginine--tRNA ligase [Patescibacteria group bacterium]|nr:arginine--tRNA ligase [Patescibacteria group bacterium]